jgi:hypothetical protein
VIVNSIECYNVIIPDAKAKTAKEEGEEEIEYTQEGIKFASNGTLILR